MVVVTLRNSRYDQRFGVAVSEQTGGFVSMRQNPAAISRDLESECLAPQASESLLLICGQQKSWEIYQLVL